MVCFVGVLYLMYFLIMWVWLEKFIELCLLNMYSELFYRLLLLYFLLYWMMLFFSWYILLKLWVVIRFDSIL